MHEAALCENDASVFLGFMNFDTTCPVPLCKSPLFKSRNDCVYEAMILTIVLEVFVFCTGAYPRDGSKNVNQRIDVINKKE